jgi:TonB-linked SusC/RagA family outer membrane protein
MRQHPPVVISNTRSITNLQKNKIMQNKINPIKWGRELCHVVPPIMRISILILWATTVQATSFAQPKIDIAVENVSLEEFFDKIQKETDYYFFYKDDLIKINKKLSFNFKEATITEILDVVLKDTGLGYKIEGNQIIIKQEQKKQVKPIIFRNEPKPEPDPIRITGKVQDANGAGLPGVTVLIVGTQKGTQTEADGSYSIEVNTGDQLAFSFVGMETQIVRVGEATVINITMKEQSSVLQELVVVAYGKETKESLTGSVSVVKNEDLAQVPVSTFEQALRGSVAGLQASAMDGAPGANTEIRIRGTGSITASSAPLYVIDGIPILSGDLSSLNGNGGRSSNVMATINPNDIESISVLKDASATAIYGSRGANGVILITTKSGKSGKAKINFSSQVGFSSPAYKNILKPLNARQYTQLFLEGWINRGDTPAQAQQRFEQTFPQAIDPVTGDTTDTNWLEAISRVGVTQSYDLSMMGGTDKFNYYFSAGYYDQESIFIGSGFRRYSARANLEYRAHDRIKISNNIFVSNSHHNTFLAGGSFENPMKVTLELSPLIPIYDSEGRINGDHQDYFPMGGTNPVGMLGTDDNIRTIGQTRILDNFAVDVKIIDNLTFKTQWNFDIISVNEYQYQTPRYGGGRELGGTAANANNTSVSWVGTQTVNYTTKIAEQHNLTVLGGYEAQKTNRETFSASGVGFPNDKLKTLNSTSSQFAVTGSRTANAFIGIFSRASYDYKQKYFVSASIRRDGSSRFGTESRWGTFYSIGGSWVMSNESFIKDIQMIDFLRMRSSYGVTGNAEIGDFTYAGVYTYGQDYDGQPGGRPGQIGNPNLTWERQKNFNLGLDFELLEKVNGTIEYFKRTSSDLILDVPISRTTGFTTLTSNFGEMVNSGVEFSLNVDIMNRGDFSWNAGFNITFLKNEVTKLLEDYNDGNFRRQVGEDFQSYFLLGWAGVDPANGDPLWYTNSSKAETTNRPANAERFFDGKKATPDHFGGFNNTLKYKRWSLDAQFMYSYGNYIFDTRARGSLSDGRLTPRSTATVAFEGRWVPGKTDATFPQHKWGGQPGSNEAANSRWLYDGSFIRLRNVTLAYDLPTSLAERLKLQSLRFYLRGTNLLTFVKQKDLYMDPEQSINGEFDAMTTAIKTFSIGLDVGF